jgi:hypothetical protein
VHDQIESNAHRLQSAGARRENEKRKKTKHYPSHSSILVCYLFVCVVLLCSSRLAPLLPLLLPLFKQQHGDRSAAVARLEMLLYLTTKSLYPTDRVMLPTSVTTAAAATVAANPPPVETIRSFIDAQKAADSSDQSAQSSAAAPSSARCERVSSFPFLPLGVAPGDVDSPAALLEDGSYCPCSSRSVACAGEQWRLNARALLCSSSPFCIVC